MIRLILLGLVFALGAAWAQTSPIPSGTWRQAAPAPSARTEVAAAAIDGRIYVVGGFAPLRFGNLLKFSVSDAVEVYDPERDRWHRAQSLPVALHHAAAVAIGRRLFVIGGFEPGLTSVWNPVATVYEYLPDNQRWLKRSAMPTARGALAAVVVKGKIYAIGGFDGKHSLVTVEVYDPVSDTWQPAAPMTVARDHLAAAVVEDKIYAIGGRIDLDYHRNLGVTEILDPAIGRWREVTPMPTPRSGIAAGVLRGMILVVGGEGSRGTFSNTEAYWPKTDSWYKLPPMPTARHGLGAAVSQGRLYTLVGGPRPGGVLQ